MKRLAVIVSALALAAVGVAGALAARGGYFSAGEVDVRPSSATPELVARGDYLAKVGGCVSCHTQAGQPLMSGGVGITTPYGVVWPGNLTPDATTGLGAWSLADFRRALRHGQSRDGRLLSPAFPYTATTLLPDADVQALWAWLGTLPATARPAPAATLSWPTNERWALAIWRGLYFTPGELAPVPGQSAEWQRGALLVRGVAHCSACHDSRNALGAAHEPGSLDGQLMPGGGWLAPSLLQADQAGVQAWRTEDIVALLREGQSPQGRANGPMAEVVHANTRHLTLADAQAMATYLRALPLQPDAAPQAAMKTPAPATPASSASQDGTTAITVPGARLYARHCAECHGDQGQGVPGVYPPLAGNRLVTMSRHNNLVRSVMEGGFALPTAAEPRPYGMPPFGPLLSDPELAELLSWMRTAWGHQAAPVSTVDINRLRGDLQR